MLDAVESGAPLITRNESKGSKLSHPKKTAKAVQRLLQRLHIGEQSTSAHDTLQSLAQEEKETTRQVSLEQAFLLAAANKERALPYDVEEIDLGRVGNDMDGMRRRTQESPEETYKAFKDEYGKLVHINSPFRHLIVDSKVTKGSSGGVKFEEHALSKFTRLFGKRLAAKPHSHPSEIVPSQHDLIGLFTKQFLSTQAELAAMVITPSTKIAVFRGELTPRLSQEEARQLMLTEEDNANAYFLAATGFSTMTEANSKDPEGDDTYNRLHNEYFMKILVPKYGLQVFECPENENVVKRVAPSTSPSSK